MKFQIEINIDNAAFQPSHEIELNRILMNLANTISLEQRMDGNLRDLNGNTVGFWEISDK
jgi:hypothetical protein